MSLDVFQETEARLEAGRVMKKLPLGAVPNLDPSRPPHPATPTPCELPCSLRLPWQPVPVSPRGGANPAPPHHFLPPPSLSLPPLCQLRP